MTATKSEVVIVSKTRMSENKICVGAYDIFNNRMLRLLSDTAGPLNDNYPYEIGQAYKMTYESRYKVTPPHTEDVAVYDYVEIEPTADHDLDAITSGLAIQCAELSNLFDGALRWENGSGFVEEENNLGYSVQIATLGHPLSKDGDYYVQRRFGLAISKVKYVGHLSFDDMLQVIPSGTKIRFSLARLWDKNGDGNRRAYLQLSGIYN
jgi:hypothetical protein